MFDYIIRLIAFQDMCGLVCDVDVHVSIFVSDLAYMVFYWAKLGTHDNTRWVEQKTYILAFISCGSLTHPNSQG